MENMTETKVKGGKFLDALIGFSLSFGGWLLWGPFQRFFLFYLARNFHAHSDSLSILACYLLFLFLIVLLVSVFLKRVWIFIGMALPLFSYLIFCEWVVYQLSHRVLLDGNLLLFFLFNVFEKKF